MRLEEAATWIRNGGIVALPTDTLYGLAADPFRADAIARVFAVKGASGRARAAVDCGRRARKSRRHLGPLSAMARAPRRNASGPDRSRILVAGAGGARARRLRGRPARVGVARSRQIAVARAICCRAWPADADGDQRERQRRTRDRGSG